MEIRVLGKQVAIKGKKKKAILDFHFHINQIIQHQAMSSILPFIESILWPFENILSCF